MPLLRWWLTIVGGLLLQTAFAENTLLQPPENCTKLKIGDTEYLKGEVYLSTHQDTSALARFGFRDIEFIGRSLGNVKYSAIWPSTVPLDSLAAFVSGLDYELTEGEIPDEAILLKLSPEIQEVFEQLIAPANDRDNSKPYRRVIVGNLANDGVEYYYRYTPAAKGRKKYDIEDMNEGVRGNFHAIPVEKGQLHTKEYLSKPSPSYRGLIHVLPVEEGPIHKWESVVVPDDPNVGTFRFLPVDTGRYYTVTSVTSRNHPAVGTFHAMPDPKVSGLRPADFGVLRNYSAFQTGQTFFVLPSGNPPRTMSVDEWRRMHTRWH